MKKIPLLLSVCAAFLFGAQTAVINGLNNNGSLSLREVPVNGTILSKLHNGDKVVITDTKGEWYHITVIKTNISGWAHGDWIKKISTPKKIVSRNSALKHSPVPKKITEKSDMKAVIKKFTP